MRWLHGIVLGGLLAVGGCGGAELGEACEGDGDCESGLVCHQWPCPEGSPDCVQTCEQLCSVDEECPGSSCSGGFCLH